MPATIPASCPAWRRRRASLKLPARRSACCRACATPASAPRFTPGARLLFYTDGLTEVFRGDEEFGPERLLDMNFLSARAQKADGILDALWAAIEDFAEGGPQGDDMTALALCRVPRDPTEIEA